jgi:membrane-associated phospholipid phosphatase
MKNLRLYLAAFILFVLASCSTEPETSLSLISGPDPTGGNWKTIAISNSDVVLVPLSAKENDASTKIEIDEIKTKRGSLTASESTAIQYWDSSAVIRWNEIARSLVIKYKTNPPMASRLYALLSFAQYDGSIITWKAMYSNNRKRPSILDTSIHLLTSTEGPSYPSDHATIAGASAAILLSIFPSEGAMLDSLVKLHEESRINGGYNFRSDVVEGDAIGRSVAAIVLSIFSADGSSSVWGDTVPVGVQYWYSSARPPISPLLPLWGKVKCWAITDMASIEAPAPPTFGSQEFLDALREVRQISDTRTAEQKAIAIKWADGGGTYTPPGHWNLIASQSIQPIGWSTIRQARAFALLNMAMFDAGVCCWNTKYKYWLIRPSQADTSITLAVPLPNFPSYSSGHSSFSAAAAEVLGYLIPTKQNAFNDMAAEAAISRVYGGIHYRFDSEAGLIMGQKVGALVVARAKIDGAD